MKMLRQTVTVLVLFASLFIGLAASTAQAEVSNLGELCFEFQSLTTDPIPVKTLQVGVLSYGAGHFALNGKLVRRELPDIVPVHGTAVVDGSTVNITFNFSVIGGFMVRSSALAMTMLGASGNYAELRLSLGGPIGQPFPTDVLQTFIDRGSVSLVPCP